MQNSWFRISPFKDDFISQSSKHGMMEMPRVLKATASTTFVRVSAAEEIPKGRAVNCECLTVHILWTKIHFLWDSNIAMGKYRSFRSKGAIKSTGSRIEITNLISFHGESLSPNRTVEEPQICYFSPVTMKTCE